jgi:hypothetical protein
MITAEAYNELLAKVAKLESDLTREYARNHMVRMALDEYDVPRAARKRILTILAGETWIDGVKTDV